MDRSGASPNLHCIPLLRGAISCLPASLLASRVETCDGLASSPLLRLAVAWTFSASVSGSEPRWDSLLSRFGGSRGYSRTWLETRVPGSALELSQGLAPASAGHNGPILPSGTHPTWAHRWHHSTHTQLQLAKLNPSLHFVAFSLTAAAAACTLSSPSQALSFTPSSPPPPSPPMIC